MDEMDVGAPERLFRSEVRGMHECSKRLKDRIGVTMGPPPHAFVRFRYEYDPRPMDLHRSTYTHTHTHKYMHMFGMVCLHVCLHSCIHMDTHMVRYMDGHRDM